MSFNHLEIFIDQLIFFTELFNISLFLFLLVVLILYPIE